jgi:hypothetical protein
MFTRKDFPILSPHHEIIQMEKTLPLDLWIQLFLEVLQPISIDMQELGCCAHHFISRIPENNLCSRVAIDNPRRVRRIEDENGVHLTSEYFLKQLLGFSEDRPCTGFMGSFF